ncbi:MAG: BolA/IbaG family iron-sulfur metabolism protein [Porticoccaceae bacterium]|nr:BolA/IbaG family iron-sulfur metabolism protein [Porticoccaceae bacterium]
MTPEDVEKILREGLPDCEFVVQRDGSHYAIRAVGQVFDSKRPVQRQQLVYAALKEQIASGSIHAVHMKLFTPKEWQKRAQ